MNLDSLVHFDQFRAFLMDFFFGQEVFAIAYCRVYFNCIIMYLVIYQLIYIVLFILCQVVHGVAQRRAPH